MGTGTRDAGHAGNAGYAREHVADVRGEHLPDPGSGVLELPRVRPEVRVQRHVRWTIAARRASCERPTPKRDAYALRCHQTTRQHRRSVRHQARAAPHGRPGLVRLRRKRRRKRPKRRHLGVQHVHRQG